MQGNRTYFSQQNLNSEDPNSIEGTNSNFQQQFKQFLSDFNRDNVRVYHKQLLAMVQANKYYMNLRLDDLKQAKEKIYEKFIAKPLEMLTVMEEAVRIYVTDRRQEFHSYNPAIPWQICIISDENPRKLREIESKFVNSLFVIRGIIISCTKPYIKASELKVQCQECKTIRLLRLAPGQFPSIPMICTAGGQQGKRCPSDPFVVLAEESQVIDTQSLKIQENPEQIPTGEIARTYNLISDRYNVNRCVPGDRVSITGIMMVNDIRFNSLSKGVMYITGIHKLKDRTHVKYSTQEEEQFKKLSKDPKLYEKIHKSIAPGIFGNENIKKAIACMLFGGCRKHLPDKTILRGDINILLMGDPSTAKSQFLKFVEQTASIAVYTSGKGSSAAGLTASINKDPATGEFQIEGGALVLADGGIVCIDEFDKMKAADRVAIHQAMEQQTISIAKAGITTRLNSRASVLAAANPVYGRYNEMLQISEQIELQTTILSRFDCIFIVRDINTDENNQKIAKHILDIHQGKKLPEIEGQIKFETLKKYINYARNKAMPRLSPSACEKLQSLYVEDRQKSKDNRALTKNSIPITVRQLEAVIRLSEALCKMKLKQQVTDEEVDEAHYLFKVSTMKTVEAKEFTRDFHSGNAAEIEKIEEAIKKRICVGNEVTIAQLLEHMERYNSSLVLNAVTILTKNGDFKSIKGGKSIMRQR